MRSDWYTMEDLPEHDPDLGKKAVDDLLQACPPSPVMLFTGAGASKGDPLRLPVTNEFFGGYVNPETLDVHSGEFDEGARLLLSSVLGALWPDWQVTPGQFDVEVVWRSLNWLLSDLESEPSLFLSSRAALGVWVDGSHNKAEAAANLLRSFDKILDQKGARKALETLVHSLRLCVFEVYRRVEHGSALQAYLPLFHAIAPFVHEQAGPRSCLPIFTTNYDRAIDSILENGQAKRTVGSVLGASGVCPLTGFERDTDNFGEERVWSHANYSDRAARSDQSEALVPYFKLHGSLGWRSVNGGLRFIDVGVEEYPTTIDHAPLMIYPGDKSEPRYEPYGTAHAMLNAFLRRAQVAVAVGFSMRDPYLLRLFREARAGGTHFVFVDPASSTPTGVEELRREGPVDIEVLHLKIAFGMHAEYQELVATLERLLGAPLDRQAGASLTP